MSPSLEPHLAAALDASLEAIVDAMPGGVVVVAASGKVMKANDAATAFLGVPWEILSTLSVADFGDLTIHEDGNHCPIEDYPVTRCLETGLPQPSMIHGVRRPDGEVSWAVFRATPLHNPGGEQVGAVITFLDITVRRAAEEKLRRSEQEQRRLLIEQQEAEAAKLELEARLATSRRLESLGVLAGGVAHDFSNLLVGILGRLDLAERALPPGSVSRQHLVDLRSAADQAAELTDQLLAYSGRGAFVQREVDLNLLLNESQRLLEGAIPQGVELRLDLASDLPGLVADATQLRQVVLNLVANAAEALSESGGTVTVETVLTDCAEHPLVLRVSDDGPGIPPECLSNVFDPFFSTKATGRGLGLAAAQGIVRGHQGTLEVTSHPGQGTVFQARFPSLDRPAEEPLPKQDSPAPEPSNNADRVVLIVDDEVHVRRVLTLALADEGYEVVTASGGAEALKILEDRADTIDLVVLDLLMPGVGGEEVFAELKRLRPELPVVLVSGYAKDVATQRLDEAGLAGFIKKPFRLESLTDLVEALVLRTSA